MRLIIFFISLFCFTSCSTKQDISDLIDFNQIMEVKMNNNSGKFYLNSEQLTQFKSEMLKFGYAGNQQCKVGGISSEIILDKDTVLFLTNTNGEYAELTANGESYTYKMNGMNLDNYLKND